MISQPQVLLLDKLKIESMKFRNLCKYTLKESSNAKITTKYYEDARQTLQKKKFRNWWCFAILPCGSGATGAIKNYKRF